MSKEQVVLVVPRGRASSFEEIAVSILPFRWRDRVTIFEEPDWEGTKPNLSGALADEVTEMIGNLRVPEIAMLILHRDLRSSEKRIEQNIAADGQFSAQKKVLSDAGIRRALKDFYSGLGYFWKVYAQAQISKYQGKSTSLDAWLHQFNTLGIPKIGRRLASALRVLDPAEDDFPAIVSRSSDRFGQKLIHAVIGDADRGGSWVGLQQLLAQRFPEDQVATITFDVDSGELQFPECDYDEIVIWEDALWSGYETVKRLKALPKNIPPSLIRFKYFIVTDFGLSVVRHAIREMNHSKGIVIDTADSEMVRFLDDDISFEANYGLGRTNQQFFRDLHTSVRGSVFREDLWIEQEIECVRSIGEQLVTNWIKHEGVPVDQDRVTKFALGGGGFASSIMFRSSVPKVCLPLYWLDGPVRLGGYDLKWRPLFIDSRRISDIRILCD